MLSFVLLRHSDFVMVTYELAVVVALELLDTNIRFVCVFVNLLIYNLFLFNY